jgi:undecaprenyl-diphosphatase
VPAILGAAGKTALEVGASDIVGSGLVGAFAAGTITSAVVGYVTIKYFLRYLAGHSLDVFAYYRLALAGGTFVWLLG